ncbi:MAG: hypothetical protein H0U03_07670 [Actinobacteria bacterium]|nr:hypothetical protein [Actinomycetota bacterium]
MRRRLILALGALGVAGGVAYRKLRATSAGRHGLSAGGSRDSAAGADPRAEELRRRLAESRALVEEREQFEAGEIAVDAAEPSSPGLDERRREVHEAGRSAAEEMRGSTQD